MKSNILDKRKILQFLAILVFIIKISSINCEMTCKQDSDCRNYYSCKENLCAHKNFFPITFFQVIEVLLVILFSAIARACGVGGGAIYSTLLMLFENFEASKAFPISNMMILLSSLSVYVLGAHMSINVPEHKFVDYDLVLVFAPMLLLGTKIGVILNNILPSILLTTFLICTIYTSTNKIYKSYEKISLKEEEGLNKVKKVFEERELQINHSNEQNRGKSKEETSLNKPSFSDEGVIKDQLVKELTTKTITISNSNKVDFDDECEIVLEKAINFPRNSHTFRYTSENMKEIVNKLRRVDILKIDLFEEAQPIRWAKIRIVAELICILIIDQLIEGSSKINSVFNIKKCSKPYTLTALVFAVICYIITIKVIDYIKKENQLSTLISKTLLKKINDNSQDFSIVECNDEQLRRILLYSLAAGVVSGMLGIGGGMILTPLFLQMGVNPKVTTSTTNFLLVFTSASSSIQYMLAGQLIFDYALIFSLLAMISSIVGYKLINDYVASTGKSSFLIYILFWLMLLSLVVLPIAGINKIFFELSRGNSVFALRKFC